MGVLFEKKTYILTAAVPLTLCILMILFSDIAIMSAKEGINLWFSSILPAMLPFFICVNFMTGIGLTTLLPANIFPFAMSALSGDPIGAKVIGDMCRSGRIDVTEAKKLLSYCCTSGPVFMVGAVGVGMLDSQMAGYVIAVSHYAGALLNGVVFSGFRCNSSKLRLPEWCVAECGVLEKLTSAIFISFKSMAVILAYIIFFTFLMELMELTSVFDIAESQYIQSLLRGIVEMTVGCSLLPHQSLTSDCIMASVIISWGGLSILGQCMSMLTGTGIKMGYLVLTKFTHSVFAGIIALFLGNVML